MTARKPTAPTRTAAEIAALVHALEVHQAELELQNRELVTANEDLQRANADLAFARDRYRALQELAPAPLVTVDPHGVIHDVNQAAELLTATPRRHLIDRRFVQLVDDATRPTTQRFLDELFAVGHARRAELRLVGDASAPTGTVVLVDGVVLPDDGPARAVLAFVDVSAQRRLDDERRALDHRTDSRQRLESLGVLAGGVAHDFNNLLTVVLAGTDHVLRAFGADRPDLEPLQDARRAARRAADLAYQMLAYSGHIGALPRTIELAVLVRELEPELRAVVKATPLVIDVSADLPTLRGDSAQLRQLLLSLVRNAAEAMVDRPGAITLVARVQEMTPAAIAVIPLGELAPVACVVIEIHDDGAGIDAATQRRVFEPYFSTKFVGRGLGLAVAQGIARGHRGAITVESVVDRGSVFRVYLPAAAPAVAAAAVDPKAAAWRGTGTILVVDDELHVQRVIARSVRALGFEVLTAFGGLDALAIFRAEGARIDVVLMDLSMPGEGGVEVARAIRALSADVPIVLVTGYGHVPLEAGTLFAGMIAKPFDLAAIQAVLARLTRSAA